MGISIASIVLSISLVTVVTWAWQVLNWMWFRPKKLERYLRQQGLSGKPYRLFFGDTKENSLMINQSNSSPIAFSNDISSRVSPFLHQTVKNYGKNSFIWIGPLPRVIIMDPDQLKDVFSKINEYQKPFTNPLAKFLATGLANIEGDKWVKHRKIINPAFHQDKLQLLIPVFYESCNEMINEWEEQIIKKESCELNVWPDIQSLTKDIISRTAFGSNFREGRKIFSLLDELENLTIQVLRSVDIPGWSLLPTNAKKRMTTIDQEIKESIKSIIKKKETAMMAGEGPTDDLLGVLMHSNYREISKHRNDENFGMTIQDVIDECKLFYVAGQETTSALLVWTIILLSKYQNWQEKAREEVVQVIGDGIPDFDELNRLKVLNMILHETLRLYPPVAELYRYIPENVKLGDLTLPAGVQINLPTVLVHQDCELWGDDASEFKPEKFCDGVSKATNNQVTYFPFGWGSRKCIGYNFALLEAKLALALILRRFSFELSPSYAHAPFTIITLQPQYGAQLILRRLSCGI